MSQLAEFAPKAIQDSLATALSQACADVPKSNTNGITNGTQTGATTTATQDKTTMNVQKTTIDIQDTSVRIGHTTLPTTIPSTRPELIPDPLFFDVPSHVTYMSDIASTLFSGSSPLLLIGDQGTGKNKITDRLLQLLKREREYMQLHRDSTVQSLTSVPTLTEGALEWVDSPLVVAVQQGRVIVIDEADKAPTETVVVLKGLVEDGVMQLSDGRRITKSIEQGGDGTGDILIHPNFRMIVLANRCV